MVPLVTTGPDGASGSGEHLSTLGRHQEEGVWVGRPAARQGGGQEEVEARRDGVRGPNEASRQRRKDHSNTRCQSRYKAKHTFVTHSGKITLLCWIIQFIRMHKLKSSTPDNTYCTPVNQEMLIEILASTNIMQFSFMTLKMTSKFFVASAHTSPPPSCELLT